MNNKAAKDYKEEFHNSLKNAYDWESHVKTLEKTKQEYYDFIMELPRDERLPEDIRRKALKFIIKDNWITIE